VDKSLSTLFKKSAMRARFGQSIVQTLSIALAMKVMYSAMVYMMKTAMLHRQQLDD
jgi:hypothetical protein